MILGHERQMKYLERARANGKLAHAYLFYGPERVGKLAVAKDFAQKLGAEITLIDREHTLVSKKDERKEIPIEDIREIRRMWMLAPSGTTWRVLIINDSEHMSNEAANAFLKLLEEPGSSTVIFLVASSRELLLPTIVSRTIPMSFSLVPDAALREYLDDYCHSRESGNPVNDGSGFPIKSGMTTHKIDMLLTLAAGRPGVLIELMQDRGAMAQQEALLRDLEGCLIPGRVPEAFALSERIAGDRDATDHAVAHLWGLLRRRLLESIADRAIREYIGNIKHLDRVSYMLDTSNVQTRLCLDALLLALQKK